MGHKQTVSSKRLSHETCVAELERSGGRNEKEEVRIFGMRIRRDDGLVLFMEDVQQNQGSRTICTLRPGKFVPA
jgi:hypothetical protein